MKLSALIAVTIASILPLSAFADVQIGPRDTMDQKLEALKKSLPTDEAQLKLLAEYAIGYTLLRSMEQVELIVNEVGRREARRVIALPAVEIASLITVYRGTSALYKWAGRPSARLSERTKIWLNEFRTAKLRVSSAQAAFDEATHKSEDHLLERKGELERAEQELAEITALRPTASLFSRALRFVGKPIVLIGGVSVAIAASEGSAYIVLDEKDSKDLHAALKSWVSELDATLAAAGNVAHN